MKNTFNSNVATLDAINVEGLSPEERLETLKAANRLVKRLENPIETILQHLAIVGSEGSFPDLTDP